MLFPKNVELLGIDAEMQSHFHCTIKQPSVSQTVWLNKRTCTTNQGCPTELFSPVSLLTLPSRVIQ